MSVAWIAHYRHPDGRTKTAEVTATHYTAAKVRARNGEADGFAVVKVVRRERVSRAPW